MVPLGASTGVHEALEMRGGQAFPVPMFNILHGGVHAIWQGGGKRRVSYSGDPK